jgi:Ca2+-binding EF-hand superfamily protein
MHTKSPAILLATIGLLATSCAPAAAQDASALLHQHLAKADANGDGAIDRAEARQAMPRLAEKFEQLDGNRDGKLTMAEVEQTLQSRWASADANHDSYIDKAEAQRAAMPRLEQAFDRLDANGDGLLSQEELHEVAARFSGRGASRNQR